MIPPLDIAESLSGGGLVFRFGVGQLFGTCDDVQCRYVPLKCDIDVWCSRHLAQSQLLTHPKSHNAQSSKTSEAGGDIHNVT